MLHCATPLQQRLAAKHEIVRRKAFSPNPVGRDLW
jgi:hypothetical protein